MRVILLGIALMGMLASCNAGSKNSKSSDTGSTEAASAELNAAKEDNKTQTSMKPISLTKAEFLSKVYNYEASPNEWKYEGDKPAIIDFYATWCGPCKVLAPILDQLAAEYADQLYIYKIDTDKEQELAAAFQIRSIPTMLFIPMGAQPQIAQGALPKAELKKIIDSVLLKK